MNRPTFSRLEWALIIGFTSLILYAMSWILAIHSQLFGHVN
ncbi:hypothetical protein [Spirosoma arboris]|nr:hypothetical protein [Spirosoma arboris]